MILMLIQFTDTELKQLQNLPPSISNIKQRVGVFNTNSTNQKLVVVFF